MKINSQNLTIAATAGFAFLVGFDYFLHGILLHDMYMATAHLWRPMDQMESMTPFAILLKMVLAVTAALIFVHGYEGKGTIEGVKFGFYLGTIMAVFNFCAFIHMPIPLELSFAWVAGSYVSSVMLGLIFAILYKKK